MNSKYKDRLNETLVERFSRPAGEYKTVAVLVLAWEKSDLAGIEQEVKEIGELFAKTFLFPVKAFRIPEQQSFRRLGARILQFIADHDSPSSLLIVYYGGHGDRNDDSSSNERRESVWAAYRQGPPTLPWHRIQSHFNDVEADVLLLFDCCHGAQAARARMVPNRVELLTACAMDIEVPPPGPHSFTTALIREIEQEVALEGSVTISKIHQRLTSKTARYSATPVYVEIAAGASRRTIRLVPMRSKGTRLEKTVSTLVFQLSLRDDLDDRIMSELAEWLAYEAPRAVIGLRLERIESMISATKQAHDVISVNSTGRSRQDVREPPTSSGIELLRGWNRLVAYVSGHRAIQRSNYEGDDGSNPGNAIGFSTRKWYIQGLENHISSLRAIVERDMLAQPQYADPSQLERKIKDIRVSDPELADLLNLRLLAQTLPAENLLPRRQVHREGLQLVSSRSNIIVEKTTRFGSVLVEYKSYDGSYREDETVKAEHIDFAEKRLRQLASILGASKSPVFHTLTCVDAFKDEDKFRFGLAFQPPDGRDPYRAITLHKIIDQNLPHDRPSMKERRDVAWTVGQALSSWHTMGWVHQGIASHGIVFFRDQTGRVEFSNPYLCGFEYARPSRGTSDPRFVSDIGLNVYRHPDRQGFPAEHHRKEHDLYSYGVLLLEIGLWELVTERCVKIDRRETSRFEMRDSIIKQARERLGHKMSNSYTKATMTCLESTFGVDNDDAADSGLVRAFQCLVVDQIRFPPDQDITT